MNTNTISVEAKARHVLTVVAGVVALWGVERLCGFVLYTFGIKFPSSVAGMLLAFGCQSSMRRFAPGAAERTAMMLTSARVFLTRWMALFFVPPLVQLPLNAMPDAADFGGSALIVAGGFVANLLVTARVASWGRISVVPPKVQSVTASVWSRRAVFRIWSIVAGVGALAWFTFTTPYALTAYGVALAVLGFAWAEVAREQLVKRGLSGVALVCHPVLVSASFVGVLWSVAQQSLVAYLNHGSGLSSHAPGNWLMALLAPAVVSLGLLLDMERDLLRANVRALLAGTTVGALFSLIASALLSRLFGVSELYARALLPKAVTTPVALVMAEIFGGAPGLTAVFVVVSGVLGALFATPILKRLTVGGPLVLGVATGVSSHGIGTAALVRDNPQAAAFSAISFALTAAVSVGFASLPPVRELIDWLLTY